MANIVLKIKGSLNPKDEDILVYNATEDVWEVQTKVNFLNSTNIQLKELNKKINLLKVDITDLRADLGDVADIVKENIK